MSHHVFSGVNFILICFRFNTKMFAAMWSCYTLSVGVHWSV